MFIGFYIWLYATDTIIMKRNLFIKKTTLVASHISLITMDTKQNFILNIFIVWTSKETKPTEHSVKLPTTMY